MTCMTRKLNVFFVSNAASICIFKLFPKTTMSMKMNAKLGGSLADNINMIGMFLAYCIAEQF